MSSMKNTGPKIVSSRNIERIELEAIQWQQQLAGKTNAEIEKEFDDWMAISELHRQAYLEAELLADSFDQLAMQPDLVEQLNTFSNANDPSLSNPAPSNLVPINQLSKSMKWMASAMAVAACLAIVSVISLDWFGRQDLTSQLTAVETFQSQYNSDTGELKNIALPDGSKLTLGANSLVKVSFSESSRQVELVQGEAYFDVAKAPNRPFFVEADQASVRVVGTRFDVRHLSKTTSISVLEGEVQVFNGKESARLRYNKLLPTTLTAGQHAKSDGKTDIVVQESRGEQDLIAWIDGRLVYRGAELRDVLADANRYSIYGNIRLSDLALGEKKVTLSVNVDSIDELPLMLAELMNLDISQSSAETVLSIKQ